MVMAFGVGYEVFVRYVLNAPTSWALDVSFIMYGTLFMMGGAYTLSRGGHVRGDFIYRLWRPRTQAKVELILYLLFFFPGVRADLFRLEIRRALLAYFEVSVNSPAGIPIFQFKTVIVAGGHPAAHPGHRPGLPLHPLHPHRRWLALTRMSRRPNPCCSSRRPRGIESKTPKSPGEQDR